MKKLHSSTYKLSLPGIYRNMLTLVDNKYYLLISIKSVIYLDIKKTSTNEIKEIMLKSNSLIIIQ